MRVVAGRYRGRQLQAPPGDATRPTSARVKEALFSILGDVGQLRVLDLYAGSGALGIEALSRGASFAAFVESSRSAVACLRQNLASLGAEAEPHWKVLPARAETAEAALRSLGPFQLVLCDPPWKAADEALGVLERLASAGSVLPGARIALEHAARSPLAEHPRLTASGLLPLFIEDERRWGDTSVALLGVRATS